MMADSYLRSISKFGGGSMIELKATDVLINGDLSFLQKYRKIKCNNIITNIISADPAYETPIIELNSPDILINGKLTFEGNNRILTCNNLIANSITANHLYDKTSIDGIQLNLDNQIYHILNNFNLGEMKYTISHDDNRVYLLFL